MPFEKKYREKYQAYLSDRKYNSQIILNALVDGNDFNYDSILYGIAVYFEKYIFHLNYF